jgi:hypothetical protein
MFSPDEIGIPRETSASAARLGNHQIGKSGHRVRARTQASRITTVRFKMTDAVAGIVWVFAARIASRRGTDGRQSDFFPGCT